MLQLLVRGLGAARRPTDAGVGVEEIDRAVVALGGVDHGADISLAADVGAHPDRAEILCDEVDALLVEVGEHEARALGGEPRRARAPDPARGSGDDDVAVAQIHQATAIRRLPPRARLSWPRRRAGTG